jgi:dTDP-4-amino-4,6-dideoxygalactose transaminase
MTGPVPFVDIAAQQRDILDEIGPDVERILSTGAFIGGPDVAAFEAAYARFIGVRHCIGVGNGTDALEIALRAAGVGTGDEVIVPANTFIATPEAVARAGARTVLVDVDPDALLIDPTAVKSAITERTKAIVPVHLYGQAAPVEAIKDLDLPPGCVVLEDSAQSQGATRNGRPAGSLADIAATSFYPGKNLGAAGDAGAILTDSDELARSSRLIPAHGSAIKYVHEVLGFNSRLDAIQAVVLSAKLGHLPRWNDARRQAARRYSKLLGDIADVVLPRTLPGNEHVWHLYVVRVPERDTVVRLLNDDGIGAAIHYPTPVHLAPPFAGLGHSTGDFPVAESAAGQILSLPMFGHITAEQQARVAQSLTAALDRL